MRALALLGLLALAGPATAESWVAMSGEDILAALTDREAVYDGAKQHFYASGRTLYDAGTPSWGYWQVRGDKYCSQWPPADDWDCYLMDSAKNGMIRFTSEFGGTTEGKLLGD